MYSILRPQHVAGVRRKVPKQSNNAPPAIRLSPKQVHAQFIWTGVCRDNPPFTNASPPLRINASATSAQRTLKEFRTMARTYSSQILTLLWSHRKSPCYISEYLLLWT